ncbi:MAG: cupin domain-containing protein [Gammaproteobacteria bacterium]|nr:cupin domain-containing protein [Gammaproteobacteria bacterium]
MKKISTLILTGLIALTAACSDKEIGVTQFPAGKVQIVHRANDMKWRPCPPTLPKNCEIAVLEGHPKKPNMFTVRFRTSGEMFMPAHTHPKDERVTLLKGKVAVAFGLNATRADATEFGPGDFYINARHEVHTVWIEKGSILQITGIGPWSADFVNKK